MTGIIAVAVGISAPGVTTARIHNVYAVRRHANTTRPPNPAVIKTVLPAMARHVLLAACAVARIIIWNIQRARPPRRVIQVGVLAAT